MAALMLELVSRHGSHFYPIDKPVVRVGRALDNDVIIGDPSVSPYHFTIRQRPDKSYELVSLADENGIRINRRQVNEATRLDKLPLAFDAGRTHVRIHDRAAAVAPTRLISCRDGRSCIFGNWGWAIALFMAMLALTGYDNYLSTPKLLSWDSFWSDQLVVLAAALGLSVGLLVVNRITSHRWDWPSSISFVSITLIVAFFLDLLLPFTDYFFTSELPGFVISITWIALALPLATAWFLIGLNHGSSVTSWILIAILFTPVAYLQFKQAGDHYNLFDEFSKKTYYSQALYPWDLRLQPTVSIEQFSANNLEHQRKRARNK